MREETLKRWALYSICAAMGAAVLWIGVRYALPVLAPFGAAYFLSCLVRSAAEWINRKTGIHRGASAAVIVVVFAALVTYLAYFSLLVLIREATGAVSDIIRLLETENNPISHLVDKVTDIFRSLNMGEGADVGGALSNMIGGAATAVSSWAARAAGSVLAEAPSCFFCIFVGLISLFYFSMDMKNIRADAGRFLPDKTVSAVSRGISIVKRALARFARAYLTIFAVTFAELLIGFAVIGINYAFLAAFITAIVDILPVFGVGTVLVPWSLLLIFQGDAASGISMLVLLCLMYVIRQIIEPKIVGNSAGVHPVTALVSVYAGYKLAGLAGMIAAPVILNGLAVLWEEKSDRKTAECKKSKGKS